MRWPSGPACRSPPSRAPCGTPIWSPRRPARGSAPPSKRSTSPPTSSGRSLAEGRHAANGIVFPDLAGPYYAEVVLGYEEAAAELGQQRADPDHPRPARRRGRGARPGRPGRRPGHHGPHRRRRRGASASPPPGCRWCCWPADPVDGVDTIRTRNERTAADLAEHLLAHGHRRLRLRSATPAARPTSPAGTRVWPRRCARTACRAGARTVRLRRRGRRARRRRAAGRPAGRGRLRQRRGRPRRAPGRRGRRPLSVPDDLAVTGWDDVIAARFAGLTTVSPADARARRHRGALAATNASANDRGPGTRRAPGAGSFPRSSSCDAAAGHTPWRNPIRSEVRHEKEQRSSTVAAVALAPRSR